jgi:phosphatidylserine decarboxylase
MTTVASPPGLPTTPQKPTSVQPGGGFCVHVELAWGRLRRAWLRTFHPGYVRRMLAKRQGQDPRFDRDVIDPRDLKYLRNVCEFSFAPEDDAFAWRGRLGIARHGWIELILFSLLFAALLAVIGVVAGLTHWLVSLAAVPILLVWAEIIYFFRDPERPIPSDPDALISPADGVITHVEEVDEPDFGRALRISIFLSIFNVHVNRIPRDGRVTQIRYFPGEYYDARRVESATRNEQLWIDLEVAGRPMRVKQISGAIARRIVCWLKEGEAVTRGERLGMIKFGSRTDLLLPAGTAKMVCVAVGDVVKGGSTILLRLN